MEENMTNEESLRLITEMIQKAKSTINENGTSAILWGSVIAVCGMMTFAQEHWHFKIGFDIWIFTLIAIIPQVIISIQERKKRTKVKTHTKVALDSVWLVYGISIFALMLYQNIVPAQSAKMMLNSGVNLFQKDLSTGQYNPYKYFPPSMLSLYLIVFAFPTMVTGIITKFKPMIFGAGLCYVFFVLSLFTPFGWDGFLTGLAGIFNWLIPGILLRRRFLSQAR